MKVLIPPQLQKVTDGRTEIDAYGKDIHEILSYLIQLYPTLKDRFYDSKGQLNKFINFYHNDEDIRFVDNFTSADNDVLTIVPAVAGG